MGDVDVYGLDDVGRDHPWYSNSLILVKIFNHHNKCEHNRLRTNSILLSISLSMIYVKYMYNIL